MYGLDSFLGKSSNLVHRLSSMIDGKESEQTILDSLGMFERDLEPLIEDLRKLSIQHPKAHLTYYAFDYAISLKLFRAGKMKESLTSLKVGTRGISKIMDENIL